MPDPTPRDEDRIDIEVPSEGFSTLAARFTGEMMKRVTEQVGRMKAAGVPDPRIIARLRTELRHLDENSLRLVYNRALGGTTSDTFADAEFSRVQEIKPGTFEIDFARARTDLGIGSVVQYLKELYTVTRLTRTGLAIKRLG